MPHRSRPLSVLFLLALAFAALAPAIAGDAPAAPAPLPAATGPQPKLVIDEPIKDLGVLPAGGTAEHAFVVRNEGDAPLEITGVHPDCGCTVTKHDPTIPPGGSGKILTAVDLANVVGASAKRLLVVSNDPTSPQTTLTLKMDVRPSIAVRPGYARYIYVQGEPPGTIAQTLWAEDFADLQVLEVVSPYPHLAVAFHEATAEERRPEGKGRQWRVDFTLAANSPVGPLAEHVTVVTNHPKQKYVKIPVSGFVRPVVAVTPPEGHLGQVDVSRPYRTTLVVQAFSTEDVKVTRVESDIAGLAAEIKPIQEGRRYQIVLSLPSGMAKGEFKGTVRIHTDTAKLPFLQVPLSGTVL
jgi:hypothetical protein